MSTDQLNGEILSHPALQGIRDLAGPGCSLPDWTDSIIHSKGSATLTQRGIVIAGDVPYGCRVIVHPTLQDCKLRIDFAGREGSTVYLGPGCGIEGGIRLNGENNIFVASGFRSQGGNSHINVTLGATCSAVVFCKDVSSVSSSWIIEGHQMSIIVCDDCMISWNVSVRNYDSHSIFDLDSFEIINKPQNLFIGRHCWIGQGVDIIKGVVIGSGSIVGARSVVTSDVPCQVAVGGVPAKIIRQRVGWDRSWSPSTETMAEIKYSTATTTATATGHTMELTERHDYKEH